MFDRYCFFVAEKIIEGNAALDRREFSVPLRSFATLKDDSGGGGDAWSLRSDRAQKHSLLIVESYAEVSLPRWGKVPSLRGG